MEQRIKVLAGHEGTVHSLCMFGDKLYSGDAERFVFVWNVLTLEKIHSFMACDDIVSALACSDKFLFAASFASIKVSCLGPLLHCDDNTGRRSG